MKSNSGKAWRFACLIVMGVLLTSIMFPVAQPSRNFAAAATTSSASCPSNEIMNYVVTGGAPNTFNYLNVHSASAAGMAHLMWLNTGPAYPMNGSAPIYADSVTNSITSNSNYTEWFFHIKPTAMWSNGQPVTAQDLINTYSSNYALNASYDFQNLRGEIVKEAALNSSTAEFVLNQSDAYLPLKMSENVMTSPVSPQWIAQGPNFNGFGVVDVTDGPFYPVNYQAGQTQLTLLRNPYFQPQPQICEIVVSFVETASSETTLLLAGSVDASGQIDPTSVQSLLGHSNLHVVTLPGMSDESLSWNLQVYPYNMSAFREAVAYGINESSIVQTAYAGYGTAANSAEGTVPPAATAVYDSNQQQYSYNPTKALSLLHSIGFTTDSSGVLHYPNGTAVSLSLWAANDFAPNVVSAGIVQTDLQKLGMTINLQIASLPTMIAGSYRNTQGIDHAMLMLQNYAQIPALAYYDALPSWDVYTSFKPYSSWLPVGTPENDYNGNVSALQATTNPTLVTQYIDNIQQLNAQYLPVLMLSYPDLVVAFNTQHFTGWNNNFVVPQQGYFFNFDQLATLTPVGASSASQTSSATSTVTLPTSVSSSSSASSTTTSTSVSSSQTTAVTSSTGPGSTNLLLAAGVVIVIVVIAVAVLAQRRRGGGTAPASTT